MILAVLAHVGREHSDATVLFHGAIAEMLGLHPTDYKVLGMLERLGPMSAGEIARESGLTPASVTDLIDRLELKGFARRARDQEDGRKVIVKPDAQRALAAQRLFASTRKSLDGMWKQFSDAQLAVIASFLARNAARLRDETKKLQPSAKP